MFVGTPALDARGGRESKNVCAHAYVRVVTRAHAGCVLFPLKLDRIHGRGLIPRKHVSGHLPVNLA